MWPIHTDINIDFSYTQPSVVVVVCSLSLDGKWADDDSLKRSLKWTFSLTCIWMHDEIFDWIDCLSAAWVLNIATHSFSGAKHNLQQFLLLPIASANMLWLFPPFTGLFCAQEIRFNVNLFTIRIKTRFKLFLNLERVEVLLLKIFVLE